MIDTVSVEEVNVGEGARWQDVQCARSMPYQRWVQPVQVTGNHVGSSLPPPQRTTAGRQKCLIGRARPDDRDASVGRARRQPASGGVR